MLPIFVAGKGFYVMIDIETFAGFESGRIELQEVHAPMANSGVSKIIGNIGQITSDTAQGIECVVFHLNQVAEFSLGVLFESTPMIFPIAKTSEVTVDQHYNGEERITFPCTIGGVAHFVAIFKRPMDWSKVNKIED